MRSAVGASGVTATRSGSFKIAFASDCASGGIVALKGVGGFHLACDAGNDSAVTELRRRKHRDEKPFAIMVGEVERAQALCDASDAELALLKEAARPIVLMRRRGAVGTVAAGVGRGPGVRLPSGWAGGPCAAGAMGRSAVAKASRRVADIFWILLNSAEFAWNH